MGQPARRFIVRAVPVGKGFAGEFAFPGGELDRVREAGQPVTFEYEDEATAAAGQALVEALNSRFRTGAKPERYRKLTGAELAVTLADLNLSPTELAFLYGTSQDRVLKWLDGEDAVPHPVRLILTALVASPSLLQLWRQVTSMVTEERSRHDDE